MDLIFAENLEQDYRRNEATGPGSFVGRNGIEDETVMKK